MSRGKQYGDQRQGSRAESHREPVEGTRQRDREPSSRNREPSSRNREPSNRDREPSDRDGKPSGRDRQSRRESRDQSDGRHARHERHSDRNMDLNGGNDATKTDRSVAPCMICFQLHIHAMYCTCDAMLQPSVIRDLAVHPTCCLPAALVPDLSPCTG